MSPHAPGSDSIEKARAPFRRCRSPRQSARDTQSLANSLGRLRGRQRREARWRRDPTDQKIQRHYHHHHQEQLERRIRVASMTVG